MSVSFPTTEAFKALARRIVWFEEPEESLSNIPRFLAYALRYAQPADMVAIREVLSDDYIWRRWITCHLALWMPAHGHTGIPNWVDGQRHHRLSGSCNSGA